MTSPIREGTCTHNIGSTGEEIQTWYRIAGTLPSPDTSSTSGRPLIALHGGPGCASDYLQPLEALLPRFGSIPAVITYDQLGSGRSTHLRSRRGDRAFWTDALFIEQLAVLVRHLGLDKTGYDLLGHSWGGCLGARFSAATAAGAAVAGGVPAPRRLVISNSPASLPLWVAACGRLRATLPKDVQQILTTHEENETTEDPEYEAAVGEFYKLFVCRADPWPDTMIKGAVESIKEDDTVYWTMNGPNEFHVIGTIKEWSIIEDGDLGKITSDTLVINGEYDPAQDDTVKPFLDQIKKVKWEKLQTSHSPMADDPEGYVKVVGEFLTA